MRYIYDRMLRIAKNLVKYFGSKANRCRQFLLKYWLISLTFILVFIVGSTSLVLLNTDTFGKQYSKVDLSKYPFSRKIVESRIDRPFLGGGCHEISDPPTEKANAALVVLARNSEIEDVIKSMKSLERHFNQWFNYPWVFLNDEPFDKEFRSKVTEVTNSDVEFGLIPKKEWDFPEDVDQDLLHEAIESQGDRGILYGNMESYHKMCRFYSGYFYEHELVKNRDWYWRVEPDVEFYCDITYDPFLELEKNNKKYGFTVLIHELYYTVPGLFRETKKYILQQSSNFKVGNLWNLFIHDSKYTTGDEKGEYSEYSKKEDILRAIEKNVIIRKYLELKEDSESSILENPQIIKEIMNRMAKMPKLYEDRIDREEYNLCHFWSNFEIARVDLFRDPFYQGYFQHLDKSGGFYMERWGDAPVHSLGIAMMLDTKDVHYFRDIGYRHSVLLHCPHNSPNQLPYKRSSNYVNNLLSPKEEKYWLAFDEVNPEISGGSGCRCRCPDLWDMEDRSSCFTKWQEITSDGYVPMEPLDVPRWEKEIDRRWERVLDSGGLIGEKLVLLPSDWR